MNAETIVIETSAGIEIIEVGIQGVPGPSGPAGTGEGGSVNIVYNAAIALSGHRMVKLTGAGTLSYASSDTQTDANIVLGMTTGAVSSGSPTNVIRDGEVTEPSWSWTMGLPIYLGANGYLTQTPPSYPASKFSLVVGFPASATKAFISVREPIILS